MCDLLNNYICEERDKEGGGTPAKVLPYLPNQEDSPQSTIAYHIDLFYYK